MEQATITHEAVLEKVRQRLGALDGKAEQAVMEAIAVLNESRQTLPQQTEAPFVSANVSLAQYEAWSPEERFQYLDNAEKANARWVEQQLQNLNAAWLMVLDGQAVAHGTSIQTLPMEQEFDALCEKYGKYPFVFFSPSLFMIEETVFDLNLLLQRGLLKLGARDYERASTHLGPKFHFFTKPLWLYVRDKNGKSTEVKLSAVCIKNWRTSPFVAINPNRTALVGRNLFLMIEPVVHLDFASRQTEIEFHDANI